jgi:hypothetical protein
MTEIYKDYQNASDEERVLMEQKYGKIFNRLMDEMASLETIKSTARQCPQCSVYLDVCLSYLNFEMILSKTLHSIAFRNWTVATR